MKVKTQVLVFLVLALTMGTLALDAHAFSCREKEGHDSGFENKFFENAKTILSNDEELGLSDEQKKGIRELKLKTKKDLIKVNAEIDILALDIKAEMWKDPVDTNAVNALIDKKYDLKKEKAKLLVGASARIKGILTEEQKESLKGFCKKAGEEKEECLSMMKGRMKCRMMGGEM